MAFKDIEALTEYEGELINVTLSSNPCPDCATANGQSMSYDEWASSEFGLPGSDSRLCSSNCHCVLVPSDKMDELPAIGERLKLRGDEDTDIRGIVDIGPNEADLKSLMQRWYELTGGQKLPPEIYKMPFDKVLAYLKQKIEEIKIED